MYKPLFENDVICVKCGYWYNPEILSDDEHICNACRRKANVSKDRSKLVNLTIHSAQILIESIPDDERDCFVYFLFGTRTELVKVGFASNNPLQRLRDCQTGSSDILRYLGCLHASFRVEQELHDILKPFGLTVNGFDFLTLFYKPYCDTLIEH